MIEHTMTTGDVARFYGVSPRRVHQLDGELKPIRLPNGQRRYSVALVEQYAEKRAAARRAA